MEELIHIDDIKDDGLWFCIECELFRPPENFNKLGSLCKFCLDKHILNVTKFSKLTPDQQNKIRTYYTVGIPKTEIARRLGIKQHIITRWFQQGKITPLETPFFKTSYSIHQPSLWCKTFLDLPVEKQEEISKAFSKYEKGYKQGKKKSTEKLLEICNRNGVNKTQLEVWLSRKKKYVPHYEVWESQQL